jgi:hypothetical protein
MPSASNDCTPRICSHRDGRLGLASKLLDACEHFPGKSTRNLAIHQREFTGSRDVYACVVVSRNGGIAHSAAKSPMIFRLSNPRIEGRIPPLAGTNLFRYHSARQTATISYSSRVRVLSSFMPSMILPGASAKNRGIMCSAFVLEIKQNVLI